MHELYRNAFETSQAQKEEQERKKAEEKAKEEMEARNARQQGLVMQRGRPKSSPVPMKPKESESPQNPEIQARVSDAKMSGYEELFEELM